MTEHQRRSTVRIIDIDSKKIIDSLQLMKGQTYNIPKGYDVVKRIMTDSLETCYIRSTK